MTGQKKIVVVVKKYHVVVSEPEEMVGENVPEVGTTNEVVKGVIESVGLVVENELEEVEIGLAVAVEIEPPV